MKEIILHIGRDKTGTTSLQHFFHHNQDFLLEHGLYYPKTGVRGIAHHLMANILNPERKFSSEDIQILKRNFETEIVTHKRILISSEAFQNIANLRIVKDFFKDYKITIIAYLREALSYKVSSYAQKVQSSNYCQSFDFYCKARSADYAQFYDKWKALEENFIIKYFDKDVLYKNDIVFDFLKCISITIDSLHYEKRNKNYSIGGNLLFFKTMLNMLTQHNQSYYNALAKLASSNKKYCSGFFLSTQDQIDYRNHLHKNNQFLEQHFGTINFKDYKDKPLSPDLKTLKEDFDFFFQEPRLRHIKELTISKSII